MNFAKNYVASYSAQKSLKIEVLQAYVWRKKFFTQNFTKFVEIVNFFKNIMWGATSNSNTDFGANISIHYY